jgi:transcriptional regulator with XRE-family HTH domain
VDITGAQIRAARAFLDWTIADLAQASGVSDKTIRLIEQKGAKPQVSGGLNATVDYRSAGRLESMTRLRDALMAAGIQFAFDKRNGQGLYCKDCD